MRERVQRPRSADARGAPAAAAAAAATAGKISQKSARYSIYYTKSL